MGLTALEVVAIIALVIAGFLLEDGFRLRGMDRVVAWIASFVMLFVAVVLVIISVQGP